MHTETKKAPGVPGLPVVPTKGETLEDLSLSRRPRYYPNAQIRQGADRVSAPTAALANGSRA
jgi:hypothetical protein